MAVGTELLLGQIADTNSAWLGEHLAEAGVASHFHPAVGDNHRRITLALRTALARSDGVIVCGGLGPTQDDITREAIAEVMNVPLVRDPEIAQRIASFFEARGRTMAANNARQADVPRGASVIPQVMGTAPGLVCPVGNKVIYAVPGVPYEMAEMFERAILPDLRARMAEAGEEGVIASRVLRTWGSTESGLAEVIARVHAILRRTGYEPDDDGILRFADVELDESAHEVRRAGNAINLTATEFNLLRYFMLNPRRVLSKHQILQNVWRYDFGGNSNVVETYVSYLRKKLDAAGPPLIRTVRQVGYMLDVERD